MLLPWYNAERWRQLHQNEPDPPWFPSRFEIEPIADFNPSSIQPDYGPFKFTNGANVWITKPIPSLVFRDYSLRKARLEPRLVIIKRFNAQKLIHGNMGGITVTTGQFKESHVKSRCRPHNHVTNQDGVL